MGYRPEADEKERFARIWDLTYVAALIEGKDDPAAIADGAVAGIEPTPPEPPDPPREETEEERINRLQRAKLVAEGRYDDGKGVRAKKLLEGF